MRPRSSPPISACRSRSSTASRTRAACASIADAFPSKALLHVAKLLTEAKHASAWGLHFAGARIDLDKLRGWKNQVVAKLTGGIGQLWKLRKVRYIQGDATIVDRHDLEVQTATRQRCVRSTTRSSPPARAGEIPSLSLDSPRVMDSTAALDLPDVPERCWWWAAATSGSSWAPSTRRSARR